MAEVTFLVVMLFAIVIFLALFTYFIPIGLWVSAYFAGVRVAIFKDLVGMRLRKVPPRQIIVPKISATKAGIEIELDRMEAHFLAGGDVNVVVLALISADKANIDLTFERAASIDLAGRDVLDAVKMSVNPKVINTPLIAAIAKDGIQVKATCRVTVRANIDRLVGGAGDETIIARVGEGIVTTIGSSDTHKGVLENPDLISKRVLEKGLDSGTAFAILSIDIADVDVGENIVAKLQTDQAEADLKIARANAEERRTMARVREQEITAQVCQMESKVKEAEAEVPLAMSEAFRSGNLGVMDYYRMRNIESDTDMRTTISQDGEDRPDEVRDEE